jgi:GxxExxY protein
MNLELIAETQSYAELRRENGPDCPLLSEPPGFCQNVQIVHENEISSLIIGAAIEVHKYYGPGLVEQVYEESLCHEFNLRGIPFKRQQAVPIYYKDVRLGSNLYLDLLVYDKVIVDNKAKEGILPIDKIKLRTYLRLSKLRLGLIINFHAGVLKDGIFRVVNDLDDYVPPPQDSFRI